MLNEMVEVRLVGKDVHSGFVGMETKTHSFVGYIDVSNIRYPKESSVLKGYYEKGKFIATEIKK